MCQSRSSFASVDISAFSSKGSIGFGPSYLTPQHSNTGSYLSIFMSNTYTERRKMQMSCVSAPGSAYNFHGTQGEDIRFLSYVRIYIYIIECKDSFPLPIRSRSQIQNFLFDRITRVLYLKFYSIPLIIVCI